MSQFIRAIEIDQTPLKMMSQYSSELAESANRESQRQQALLKMQQEQDAALGSAFGDLYKMGLDRVKDLTAEQRDIALEQLKTGLAQSLKDSKGNPAAFKVSALTGPIKQIVTYEASRKDIASAGAERSKQLAAAGIRGDAVEAFTAKYMLDPSKATSFNVQDFYAEMDQDIAARPQLYMDKEKLRQTVIGRLSDKGVDFEREVQLDPTGVNKKTASVKMAMKPWETTGKIKMPNGIEVEAPQIKTENINGMNVIAQESFDKFIGDNPLLKTAVITAAKETVHDINKKLGVNTEGMSVRDFSIAKSQDPNLIDPFNDGVVEVYAKDALTKMLKGNYDDQGFSIAGKRAYGAIKDNPPRTSVTVNTGQTTPQIDLPGIIADKVAADKAEAKKNNVPYKWTQINTLDDRVKDAVMDKAKSGLPDAIKQSVGQESFYIKPGQSRGKNGIGVYAAVDIKDPNDIDKPPIYKAGQFISWVGGGASMKANEKLGKAAVQGAAVEGGGVKRVSKSKKSEPVKSGVTWK
jgi:hypothetical protein